MTLFSCKDLTLGYDGRAVAENLNFESVKTVREKARLSRRFWA